MAESIIVTGEGRELRYASLLPQIESLVMGEPDLIANLSNIVAALKQGLGFLWVGFYLVKGNDLVLGPFQGTVACSRIAYGKGVCGKAWEQKKSIIVEDVDNFPGHIACSSLSRSEIVLPAFDKNGHVLLVLDVDSDKPADFNDTDLHYLQKVLHIIEKSGI